MTDTIEQAVRCSAWARAESLDPIASAGSYSGFVMVEAPLPWPRDASEIAGLAGVAALAAERGWRLQALVPEDKSDERLLSVFVAPAAGTASPGPAWFAGFERRSTTLAAGADPAAAAATLASAVAPAPAPVREVLVCTHGRRDVCCGSQGTELSLRLSRADRPGDTPWPAGVGLRRTSHTGGHRFAPTFLVFPEATAWAFADPQLVHQVLQRSVPFASVAPRYRGCAGLDGPLVQAVEREVLASEGWEVIDLPRRGYETGEEAAGGRRVVRFEAGDRRGGVDAWEALVSPGRTVPVPDCGKPLSVAKKTQTEWVVSELRRV